MYRATFRQLFTLSCCYLDIRSSNQRRYIYIYISNHPPPWKSRHDRPPRVLSGARTHDGRRTTERTPPSQDRSSFVELTPAFSPRPEFISVDTCCGVARSLDGRLSDGVLGRGYRLKSRGR